MRNSISLLNEQYLVMFNSIDGTTYGADDISIAESFDSQLSDPGVDPAVSPLPDSGYMSSNGDCVSICDGSPSLPPLYEDMGVAVDLLSEVDDSDVGVDSLMESNEDLLSICGKIYSSFTLREMLFSEVYYDFIDKFMARCKFSNVCVK